jgi:hypothetical protein
MALVSKSGATPLPHPLPQGERESKRGPSSASRRVHAAGWRADAPRGLLRLPAANARAVAIYVALEAGVDRAVIARTAGLALPTLRFASQRVGDSAGKNPCLSEALGEAMTAARAAMRAAAAAELHGLG